MYSNPVEHNFSTSFLFDVIGYFVHTSVEFILNINDGYEVLKLKQEKLGLVKFRHSCWLNIDIGVRSEQLTN